MASKYEEVAQILDGCEGNTLLARRLGQVRPNIIRKLLNMDTSDCIPFTGGARPRRRRSSSTCSGK